MKKESTITKERKEQPEINKTLFGNRVREARERLKLTQEELSEEVGMSKNYLSDIERGIKIPSIPKLIPLSNELKLGLDAMFSDSLDNIFCEPEEIYYTDRQLALVNNMVKTLKENF